MIVSPLDAPALLVGGAIGGLIYSQWLSRRNPDWFVGLSAGLVGVFWIDLVLVSLVGGLPWGVAPAVRTNSVVLAVSVALAYPFWVWLGGQIVFVLLGRRPSEGGMLWLYRIEDTTEPFDPPWNG